MAKSWVKSAPVRCDKEQRKNSIPWLSFAKRKKEIYRSGFCSLFINILKAGVIFLGLLWQAVGILYWNLISNLGLHIEGFCTHLPNFMIGHIKCEAQPPFPGSFHKHKIRKSSSNWMAWKCLRKLKRPPSRKHPILAWFEEALENWIWPPHYKLITTLLDNRKLVEKLHQAQAEDFGWFHIVPLWWNFKTWPTSSK